MPKDNESQDDPLLELLDRLRWIVALVAVGVHVRRSIMGQRGSAYYMLADPINCLTRTM